MPYYTTTYPFSYGGPPAPGAPTPMPSLDAQLRALADRVAELTKERDQAKSQSMAARVERNAAIIRADDLADRFTTVKEQRDEAERDLQFARGRVVQEQTARRAEVKRLEALALGRERVAGELKVLYSDSQAEVRRLKEVVTRQYPIIRAAEAKVADIGWRKNKLIAAIEKRGFVVRWQKDGTPTISTPEEIKAEEIKAEEERRKQATKDSLFRSLGIKQDGSSLAQFLNQSPIITALLGNYPQKVVFSDFAAGMGTAPAVNKPPVGAPKPNPLTEPRPDAQRYYDAAVKECYGYPVAMERLRDGWISSGLGARLDGALERMLRRDFAMVLIDGICPDGKKCGFWPCTIYRNRPWKRA